ncbi:MAG: hypothetical protein IJU19_03610 [Bacteroidales bacterium]|nr:hypothetical protein [Bacteroidales bacterium]
MKILVSHDVDHLYPRDHYLRDLIFPKLVVRSALQLLSGKLRFRTFLYRVGTMFGKRLNRIPELVAFDKAHGVKAVYFFGMANGKGMSYRQEDAKPWIEYVRGEGFDVGVHGISYGDESAMQKEHDDFARLTGMKEFGIREHYVRYDGETFRKMARVGYLFDSTEFSRESILLKPEYKVDAESGMIEFPLAVMDGYVVKWDLQEAKDRTVAALRKAEEMGLSYFTVLFHDYLYNENAYPLERGWYEWLIEYCQREGYEFATYREAIKNYRS